MCARVLRAAAAIDIKVSMAELFPYSGTILFIAPISIQVGNPERRIPVAFLHARHRTGLWVCAKLAWNRRTSVCRQWRGRFACASEKSAGADFERRIAAALPINRQRRLVQAYRLLHCDTIHPMKMLIAVLTLAWCAQAQDAKTAEQVYKNIVELKGTPADQVGPAMQFISASLGVNCEFCHVQGKFEADDKGAKKTAREMIAMQNMINKNSFRGRLQVTCNTCHRGSARPVAVPPVQESDAMPQPMAAGMGAPPAGGAQVTTDQVIEKYVAAVGGADAIKKITSREMKGTITAMGSQSSIDVLTKAPNKRITISHTGNGESYTAFDGKEGWMGSSGRPARTMSPPESAASSIDAEFYLPLRLKEMFPQLRRGRPETVNGVECEVLNGSAPGMPTARFYFARNTGLLMRQLRLAETSLGRIPTQIDYADFKSFDGVMIPLRWTLSRPNGRFTIQVNEVKINAAIDDAKFAKPAAQ
jgi:outer membrane lipoprotein-sorting protein